MKRNEKRPSAGGGNAATKELRTPRAPEDASRGLTTDFKVNTPLPPTHDELVKKFGPLTVEIQQAYTAILMLESGEINIVIDSLNALQKFCKRHEDNKEFFVELGGLIPISKRIADPNLVVQRMCMKILALVSTLHKTKLFVRDLNLAKDIIALCASTDDIIVEYSTRVLANLCCLHTGRIQICQDPNGLSTLVNLLAHSDPDIQRNALETIWQISSDPLHVGDFTDKTVLGPLLRLVDSEYPPLQALALMSIEQISARLDGVATLDALNATEVLARKLTNETMVDLHRYCLKIFYNECRDRSACRKFAFLAPAIAEIVERTPDPVARGNGLDLLGRLCSLEIVAHTMSQSGMPFLLFNLLTRPDSDDRLKEACAFIIAQISRSAFSAKRDFVKCVPHLLGMIKAKDPLANPQGAERAFIALSFIMEDIISAFGEFAQSKGFEVIRNALQNPESYSDDSILSALNILDLIAGNPALRKTLSEAQFMPILLNLLNQEAGKTSKRGSKKTANPEPPKEKRLSQKPLPKTEESLEVKQEVEVNDASGVRHRSFGSATMARVNPQILSATCSVLCSLLCEPATHADFIEQKGPELIMSMMGHNEFPVISAAVSIVNVACVNSVLGKEMLDKGLLQVMWRRGDLISKNGPMRAAFDRLISCNLPLKYSITGHLSPFEIIQEPFFDMEGLKHLEELKLSQDFVWNDSENGGVNKKVYYLNVTDSALDNELLDKNPSLKLMQTKKDSLKDLIYAVEENQEGMTSEPALVEFIATAVSDRFGGPLDKWRLTAKAEDMEMESLQNQYKSVIIPVSFLTAGTFRVRALVFKALCDMFGIPCSLETSDYRKTWNVVLLRPDERFPRMCPCLEEIEKHGEDFVYTDSLRRYVVDLVFQPGSLLPLGSFGAETYISAS